MYEALLDVGSVAVFAVALHVGYGAMTATVWPKLKPYIKSGG